MSDFVYRIGLLCVWFNIYLGNVLQRIAMIIDVVMSNLEGEEVNTVVLTVSDFSVKVAGPNPFNPSTTLNVVVPADGHVSVKIYNILGQEVVTLVDGFMHENFNGYNLNWNASNLASGEYLVRAESAGQVSNQKLMLLK